MSRGGAARTGPSLQPPSTFTNNNHPTELAIILLQIKDDIPDIFFTSKTFSSFLRLYKESTLGIFHIARNYLATVGFSFVRAMVVNVIFQQCIIIL